MSRLGVIALLLVSLNGCAPEITLEGPRHVFLITVDTLRADHLGTYGYQRNTSPSLDALATQGVVFERAITPWAKTGPAFAAMFVGRYPGSTGLTHTAAVRIPPDLFTLPELMQQSGFTTVAVVSNPVLSAGLGWNRGFDEYIETWKETPGELPTKPQIARPWINAVKVNELALPLLDRFADQERLFVWLHYSDPHAPYILPDGVDNEFLDDEFFDEGQTLRLKDIAHPHRLGDETSLGYFVAQYDANVRVVDEHIDRAVDHIRQLGLLDDALLVFTSDHGESLAENEYYFDHGALPYNNAAHVPLFFLGKGVSEDRRVPSPVGLVDILPTMRDLVSPGRELSGIEGRSLLSMLEGGGQGSRPAYAFSEAGQEKHGPYFWTAQDARWKLISTWAGQRVGHLEAFYDLQADPGETTKLSEIPPEDQERLRAAMIQWTEGMWAKEKPSEDAPAEDDEETVRALKALGYIN